MLVDKSSLLMLSGMTIEYKKEIFGSFLELKIPTQQVVVVVVKVLVYKMNYDRKKQEELLYNEKVRHISSLNMQSDAIEMSNMIVL